LKLCRIVKCDKFSIFWNFSILVMMLSLLLLFQCVLITAARATKYPSHWCLVSTGPLALTFMGWWIGQFFFLTYWLAIYLLIQLSDRTVDVFVSKTVTNAWASMDVGKILVGKLKLTNVLPNFTMVMLMFLPI
jgi:hypothetical protein